MAEIDAHLLNVDGVMLGREAYHNPYMMAEFDAHYYHDTAPVKTQREVLNSMLPYVQQQLDLYASHGLKLNSITRHMLGLMSGLTGARQYRQILSDSKKLALMRADLLLEAAMKVSE